MGMLKDAQQDINRLFWCTCSARGIRDTYRCLFQNSECAKLIGTSRTQEAYSKTLAAMPNSRQRQWYAWVKGVMVGILDLLTKHSASLALPILHVTQSCALVQAMQSYQTTGATLQSICTLVLLLPSVSTRFASSETHLHSVCTDCCHQRYLG